MKQSQRVSTVHLLAAMFFSAGAASFFAAGEASAGDRIYKHVGPDGRVTYSSEPGGKEFNAPRKAPSGAAPYRATTPSSNAQTSGVAAPRVTAASQPQDEPPNKGRAGGGGGGGGAPGGGGGGGGGGGLAGSTNSGSNAAAASSGSTSSAASTGATGGNGASSGSTAGTGSTGPAAGAAAPAPSTSGGNSTTGGAPAGTTSGAAAATSSGGSTTTSSATRTAAAQPPSPPPPPPPQPPALPRSITASSDYLIGTYYFPGWKDNQPAAPAQLPWERIKAYPEREPMLGWYREGEVEVMQQHLRWMYEYGIDFVAFDWYWTGKETFLEHALRAYMAAQNNVLVPYVLLWANHFEVPRNLQEFDSMVDFWISRYFLMPQYMRLAGMPAVVIFSHPHLQKQAAQLKMSTADMLKRADARAKSRGFPGIFFVGGTHVDMTLVNKDAIVSGYGAFTAYNYHGRGGKDSESYAELDDAYQNIWKWIVGNSPIPYFVPMTSGWDKRPWGGSKNPLHDNSFSDPDSFERHLVAAKAMMDANPVKTQKIGIICCWNEFGEGSYIEPTKRWEFDYLERVKKVFGSSAK